VGARGAVALTRQRISSTTLVPAPSSDSHAHVSWRRRRPVAERLDPRLAAAGRRRAVGAHLGVAEPQRVAVARADEEAEADRAAAVARVDDAVGLGVVDGLRPDVAARDVRGRAEAAAVKRWRRPVGDL